LPLIQGLEPFRLDGRVMHKHIILAFARDETIAFGGIKPFDDTKTKYTTYGKMKRVDDTTIQITELPIGMWTDKFKEQCYTLIEKGMVSKMIYEGGVDEIDFTLKNVMDTSAIKLTSTLHTTNMVLFNHDNIITKYNTINSMFNEYFKTRLHYYKLRKNHMLTKLRDNIALTDNKLRFILKVVNDNEFLKQEEDMLVNILEKETFLKVDNAFNYLLNIPVRGCTLGAIKLLETKLINLKCDLKELEELTINQMWLQDLDQLAPYLE